MKSILAQRSPHKSPWAPARLRQEMQWREEEIGPKVQRAANRAHRRKEPRPLGKSS
jgi:hypothetical protein